MDNVKIVDNKYIYPVDTIFVLLLTESKGRKGNVKRFLSKLNSGNNIKIVETVKKPWLKFFIDKDLKYNHYANGDEEIAALDCAMNHYNIIKSSYEKGLEHIMIVEDDANFICDIEDFIQIINDIPNNADILQFIPNEVYLKGFMRDFSWINYKAYDSKMKIIKKMKPIRWSTIMYILNRNGMKYFIDYYDNNITIADQPFFDYKSDLNYYVCNKPVMSPKFKSNILSK